MERCVQEDVAPIIILLIITFMNRSIAQEEKKDFN